MGIRLPEKQIVYPGLDAPRASILLPGPVGKRLAEEHESCEFEISGAYRERKEEERGSGGVERKDTSYYLLNGKDPMTGKEFTVEELQADTSLLISVGSDGVTLAICALFFYALQQPQILHKVANKSARRSGYVIHRNVDGFPEPMPERWIIGNGVSAGQLATQNRAFCPFGGPINCISRNTAYLDIKLVLAHLLCRLDFRVDGGLIGGGNKEGLKLRTKCGIGLLDFRMVLWYR